MQITPTNIKIQPSADARRGSGRSMATLLAAQLWAVNNTVVIFQYQNTLRDVTRRWINTLPAGLLRNLQVYEVSSLEAVADKLRGTRYSKVFVDHHLVELAERKLAERLRCIQADHDEMVKSLEVIR